MNQKYYLVGEYKTVPVYYSRNHGFSLGSRMDEIVEPTEIERNEIISNLGGMKSIEQIIHNYEKNEVREAKNDKYR